MQNSKFRKGLVFGMIVLFVGAGVIPSTVGIIDRKTSVRVLNNRGYIQDLIDNASDGDTIYISSGTYNDNIVIDKSINLVGEDKNTTIITGGGFCVITIIADWVNISEFTITGSGYEFGINIKSNYNSVVSTIITNTNGGIYLDSAIGNIITSNYFNRLHGSGICISLEDSIGNNISYNTISNTYYMGISLLYSSYNTILGNHVSNQEEVGIFLEYSNNNNIIDNKINWTSLGLGIYDSSNNYLRNNLMINNNNNFKVSGRNLEHYIQDIDISNTVDGKPIYCFSNIDNPDIPSDIGCVIFLNCTNLFVNNLSLENNGQGILIVNTHNSVIKNNFLRNNGRGINIVFSNYTFIANNTIFDGGYGIFFQDSYNNTILDNIITNNSYGIGNNYYNTIETNYITYNGIGIINCVYTTIQENNISNNYIGIENNYYTTIIDNIIQKGNDGILMNTHTIIKNNNISNNGYYGISGGRGDNSILENNITNSFMGISNPGDNNVISFNNIIRNWIGIDISDYDNIINGNNIISNSEKGIRLYNSQRNRIYHNNFINNSANQGFPDNQWDDGKYGNYWSDYEERYPDAKPKILKPWMWDTPYEIPGGGTINKDNCPLVNQWPKSRTRTPSRTQSIIHPILQWLIERFPLLERLLNFLN